MSLNSQKNIASALKALNGNNLAKKDYSITRIQRAMLPLPCLYAKDKTWAEWLAERGMALAAENAAYYREIMDRLEGKVTQPIEAAIKGDVRFIIGKGYDNRNEAKD